MQKVIYPGTVDPVTNGHIDVIRRATEYVEDIALPQGTEPMQAAISPDEKYSFYYCHIFAWLRSMTHYIFD